MRRRLEFMADRIEAVLAVNEVPARVTGGTVTPRWVRFQVLPVLSDEPQVRVEGPAVGANISKIKGLSEELAAALDAPNCRVSRRGAAVALEIPRQDPQPVRLLPLYRQLNEDALGESAGQSGSIPAMTATLGLAEDGAPLLIRLPSPDVAHILVAGTPGAGKTTLLRAIILSLAMANTPHSRAIPTNTGDDGLMLTLVDPTGQAFDCFEGLPHLARPVIKDLDETIEALNSLVRLMEKRGDRGDWFSDLSHVLDQARVVVVIDELADLLMMGGVAISEPLTRLTQRGREVGIHVVAATSQPTPAVLGPLVKANAGTNHPFPVRLVGRVTSAEEARTASSWSGTGAERLTGRGDFLAVAEGRVLRFQAAHVSEGEIREVVACLAQGETLALSTTALDTTALDTTALGTGGCTQRPAALPWPVNRLTEAFKGT